MGNVQQRPQRVVVVAEELSKEDASQLIYGLITIIGISGLSLYMGYRKGRSEGQKAERGTLERQINELRESMEEQAKRHSEEKEDDRKRNRELLEEIKDLQKIVRDQLKNA